MAAGVADDLRPTLSIAETGKALKISRSTVYAYIARGFLDYFRSSDGSLRIYTDSLIGIEERRNKVSRRRRNDQLKSDASASTPSLEPEDCGNRTLVLEIGNHLHHCATAEEAFVLIQKLREARQLSVTHVYGPIEMFLALLGSVNRDATYDVHRDRGADLHVLARWKAESGYGDWFWIDDAKDRLMNHDSNEQQWLRYGGFRIVT